MKHRILSAILLLCLMAACTVSCAENENPHTDVSDTTEAVTESPYIDDLPSDLKFGGEKVYITLADYSSAFYDEMYSEEREGNRFNEAVYLAILSVEERLEADLEYTRREYTWNNRMEHYSSFEFIYDNERNVDIFQTVVEFVNSNEDVLAAHGSFSNTADYFIPSGGANSVNKQFVDGNALFTVSLIADAATIIPEVSFEYGILPLPKYDEAQEYYLNSLQRHINVLIPATCRDVDRASAIIEALTSEFHTSVIPEYVEVTLKTRYSPTDNISRMFDIATDTITFYPDALYGSSLTLLDIKAQIGANNPNWVSVVASVKKPF